MKLRMMIAAAAVTLLSAGVASAAGHATLGVKASDQSFADGTVTADEIVAGENGWLVVHRVKDNGKPGPVVGHAPIRAGMNSDVAAILTEDVAAGDKLMLMVHSEAGGEFTGEFEYSLGAKEDGPIRVDGNLVMTVVTGQ